MPLQHWILPSPQNNGREPKNLSRGLRDLILLFLYHNLRSFYTECNKMSKFCVDQKHIMSKSRKSKPKKLPTIPIQPKHNIPLNFLESLPTHNSNALIPSGHVAQSAISSPMMPSHPAAYFMNPLAYYWPLFGQPNFVNTPSLDVLNNVLFILTRRSTLYIEGTQSTFPMGLTTRQTRTDHLCIYRRLQPFKKYFEDIL